MYAIKLKKILFYKDTFDISVRLKEKKYLLNEKYGLKGFLKKGKRNVTTSNCSNCHITERKESTKIVTGNSYIVLQ